MRLRSAQVLWEKAERGRSASRPEQERPARSKADTTCPNCFEKGHTGQECTKPKIDVKDRACFDCGERGSPAARCPKAKLKALTREQPPPTADGRRPAPRYILCLDSDGFVPAHRLARKTKPAPKSCLIGDAVETAFTKLARLEALEGDNNEPDTEAVEPPHAPAQRRPGAKKHHFTKLARLEAASPCNGRKSCNSSGSDHGPEALTCSTVFTASKTTPKRFETWKSTSSSSPR